MRLFPRGRAAARRRRLPPRHDQGQRVARRPVAAGRRSSAARAAIGLWLMGVPYFYVLALIAAHRRDDPDRRAADRGDSGGRRRASPCRRRWRSASASSSSSSSSSRTTCWCRRSWSGRSASAPVVVIVALLSAARCSASSARSSRCRPRRSSRCFRGAGSRGRRAELMRRAWHALAAYLRHHHRRHLAAGRRPGRDVAWDLGDSAAGHVDPAVGLRAAAAHPPGDSRASPRSSTRNIFHPAPLTLAYSEHFIAQAIQILPVYAVTRNPILCYNLLFLSTFVLSGLGMYLLVRELTGDARGGVRRRPAVRVRAVPAAAGARTCRCCRRSGCRSRCTASGGSSTDRRITAVDLKVRLYGRWRPLAGAAARAGRAEPVVQLLHALLRAVRRGVRGVGRRAAPHLARAADARRRCVAARRRHARCRCRCCCRTLRCARRWSWRARAARRSATRPTSILRDRRRAASCSGVDCRAPSRSPKAICSPAWWRCALALARGGGVALASRPAAAARRGRCWPGRCGSPMLLHVAARGRGAALSPACRSISGCSRCASATSPRCCCAPRSGRDHRRGVAAGAARMLAFLRTRGFFVLALLAAVWLSLGPAPRSLGVPIDLASPYSVLCGPRARLRRPARAGAAGDDRGADAGRARRHGQRRCSAAGRHATLRRVLAVLSVARWPRASSCRSRSNGSRRRHGRRPSMRRRRGRRRGGRRRAAARRRSEAICARCSTRRRTGGRS